MNRATRSPADVTPPVLARGRSPFLGSASRLTERFDRAFGDRPALALLLRIGVLVVLTVGLERWLLRLTHLPEQGYTGPVILFAFLRRLVSGEPQAAITVLAGFVAGAAAIRYRSFGPRWADFENGARLRLLVVVIAALLAWIFATYDYNFYYGRAHGADRLALLALAALVYWRPVMVLPFATVLFAVAWQFTYPIEGWSWAAPILLVRALLLFAAFWLVRLLSGRARTADLLFVLFCLVAAHYWVSGVGKLRLGWVGRDTVAFLLPSTYANGWLGFLAPSTIASAARALIVVNVPIKLATMLVECGSPFALARPGVLRIFLVLAILFHAAIFLLSGIFFWSWILLEAVLLVLFLRRTSPPMPIFTRAHFLLSVVLIMGGGLWFRPVRLSWLDARATYTYRMIAEGESGRAYPLGPLFFAPYDFQFTLNAFRYLAPDPRLSVTWGASGDPATALALQRAVRPEEVLALEATLGQVRFDSARAAAFDRFIGRFVDNWNRRPRDWHWWTPWRAPPLLWTFPLRDPAAGDDRLVRVVVHEVVSMFDGERYLEIRDLPVRSIDVIRRD